MLRQSAAGILAVAVLLVFALLVPVAEASNEVAQLTASEMSQIVGGSHWQRAAAVFGTVAFVAAVALTAGGAGLVLAAAVTTVGTMAAGSGVVVSVGAIATIGIGMMAQGAILGGAAAVTCSGNRYCP